VFPVTEPSRAATLALLLLTAAAAPVLGGDFSRPAAHERLEAGSTEMVAWRLDKADLDDADETELLLSLDGGAHFPIRLTARIAPETRAWVWRVPALPTERARLALRFGRGERAGSERIVLSGPEFSIVTSTPAPLEELFADGSEWRTREALRDEPLPPAPSSCRPETQIGQFREPDLAGVTSHSPVLDDPHRGSAAPPQAPSEPGAPKITPSSRRPALVPLRE
jgi:hypothetical protein